MNLNRPVRIADGVFQIRVIGARVTVVVEDGNALLIDAGTGGTAPMIRNSLAALGLSIDSVQSVVVTHDHPDHTGGLAELVSGTGISVMAHRLEVGVLSGEEPRPNPIRNGVIARLAGPVIERMNGRPVYVDIELEDGDEVPFGTPIRVVHLPGHTAGSIALHLPEKRLMIVGDALQYKLAMRLSPPAPNVTEDPDQAMRSIEKLLELEFDTIVFSHFPPMRYGARAAIEKMISAGPS